MIKEFYLIAQARVGFVLFAFLVLSTAAQAENVSKKTADSLRLPRQIAPHLFRVYDQYDLPRALVVQHGKMPNYSLANLATWECHEGMNPQALPNCASYFMSRKPIALKTISRKEKAGDEYGYTKFEVELTDGQRLDVWATENGCAYFPDGSQLRAGIIEDHLQDLRSPWGPEPYNNIAYNNMLYPGQLPYLQRVAADGRVLWAYVYLVRTTGYTVDRGGNPQVENPLLGFGSVVCPKGSGATGFLTSAVFGYGSKFAFGSMAIEIDTYSGEPKTKHPRIRVVPIAAVEQQYRKALAELIEEGVITEKNTLIEDSQFGNVPPPSRFLDAVYEFSDRLQSNLLKTYFTDAVRGVKK